MNLLDDGILDEWHFVVGGGSEDQEVYYQELERLLADQIQALGLISGYTKIGGLFNRRTMHFVKYGSYRSLTLAEPFGADLNVSWYLYFTKAGSSKFSIFLANIIGHFAGRTLDRVYAFGAVGKSAAEEATKTLLQGPKRQPKPASGKLGRF